MNGMAVTESHELPRLTPYDERSDLAWAMSAHGSNVDQRRNLIGLSSRSAMLASAAHRRQQAQTLDEEERRSLERMRDELRRDADDLTKGVAGRSAPEHTYAFVTLASMAQRAPIKDSAAAREEYIDWLMALADKIDTLTHWDAPVADEVAEEVAEVFTELSRLVLRHVARTGESSSGLSRPRS